MKKTETIHARIAPEIKKQAETIFKSVGLTTSQAITLFLIASVNHNGLPFELSIPSIDQQEINFATAIVKVDGVSPSKEATNVIRSYLKKEINYKKAIETIKGMYKAT